MKTATEMVFAKLEFVIVFQISNMRKIVQFMDVSYGFFSTISGPF